MNTLREEALKNGEEYWELRLGINTGEVTAGVIGSERLAYDIWGATVNQAQRMEMMGEPGRVTISGSTFKLIEPYFECTYRGKVKTKSKGLIEMFTVERIKPELSINGEGLYPNDRFQQIVAALARQRGQRHDHLFAARGNLLAQFLGLKTKGVDHHHVAWCGHEVAAVAVFADEGHLGGRALTPTLSQGERG